MPEKPDTKNMRTCEHCLKDFTKGTHESDLRFDTRRYCSRRCSATARIGSKLKTLYRIIIRKPKPVIEKRTWEDTWDAMEFFELYDVYGEHGKTLGLYERYITTPEINTFSTVQVFERKEDVV